jgi:hypothetical protein
MRAFRKQEHGEPNPIFREEERKLLAAKDQAVACGNPQIIGRNGEIPLMECFRRYLPSTFRVETGFFMTPEGELSPQLDIMLLDARYPLLSHNTDGSVIAMLHAVVHVIEVKTTVGKREIKAILEAAEKVSALSTSVFPRSHFEALGMTAFGYGAAVRLDSVEAHFFDTKSRTRECDLLLLRVDPSEVASDQVIVGAELPWEPETAHFPKHATSARCAEIPISEWFETTRFTHAPLSDLYYDLIQQAYYTIGARGFDFGQIGAHMMAYMSWGTYRQD